MFFDLNFPILSSTSSRSAGQGQSKKNKGKQPAQATSVTYSSVQLSAIENRLDLLIHLGYTVIAFNQIVQKKIDPKAHANTLDALLAQLRKREGIVYLKRLTIVLDEESEKGFGLTSANAPIFNPYDLIALIPTTPATFSAACLTHSQPSNLTAHIISLPLTLPRLPYYLKHTLVRSAIKSGVVFEINYAGALGGDSGMGVGGLEVGTNAKRNWWAGAREVVRSTKGKGIIVSGGITSDTDLRAPRDVGNLITLAGLAQDAAHHGSSTVPKSLVLRAQTRKTYRAVLSEPRIIVPAASTPNQPTLATQQASASQPSLAEAVPIGGYLAESGKKRPREGGSSVVERPTQQEPGQEQANEDDASRKRKRKRKNKVE